MHSGISVCVVALLAGTATADILRVDDGASPNGDGSSWGRAFDSLTDALAASASGDQIWVAGGVYIPELPAGRDATFTIPNGVAVFGGFSGNENSLAQRGNPLSPATTLNGAQPQSYHVVSIISANSSAILDGFYITKGTADVAGGGRNYGAGIYADDSTPTLRNLDIRLCNASSKGGGIYLGGTAGANISNISDCTIENNIGDGIYTEVDTLVIDCRIADNSDSGIQFQGPGTQLATRCVIDSNSASGASSGGITVIMTSQSARSVIADCEFIDNTGIDAGAVSYINLGDHEIQGSRFFGNSSSGIGGGAVTFNCLNLGDTLLIENSLMTGNGSTGPGAGGVYMNGPGDVHIVNSTIAYNTTDNGPGGGVVINDGTVRIDNSIIWGNDADSVSGQDDSVIKTFGGTAVTIDRTIVQGLGVGTPVFPGIGNLSANPKFVDINGADNTIGTDDDNARLQPTSPAIDRGDNLQTSISIGSDIYGDPRFVDDPNTNDTGVLAGFAGVIDLGAAEFQPPPFVCLADVNGDGMVTPADFTAWIAAFNANAPECDQNNDGSCTPADFTAWIANYNAGCP